MAGPFSRPIIAPTRETAETMVLLDPITLRALAADRNAGRYVAAAELERVTGGGQGRWCPRQARAGAGRADRLNPGLPHAARPQRPPPAACDGPAAR
ncbi:hypothetical protein DTW92_20315 [Paracoccus pantotrophus]|nr:hypothetical protein DTW92_20315 [Paracoccus pantotrophus]RNI19153.1 hypothetical protein EB844_03720 [Paracoccus pantotrophus]WGR64065.1 hypothetical protein E3U24_01565 [Paracoccus pantotrophus]